MAGKAQAEAGVADQPAKAWRPSGRPAHRVGESSQSGVVEQQIELGTLGRIAQFVRRPFVRLIIGLGIFILGAIVYDKTVNFGEWTERKERAKASQHRGADPIQQTPDG